MRAWRSHTCIALIGTVSLVSAPASAVPLLWETEAWAERWALDSGQGPVLSLHARVADTRAGREGLAYLTLTLPWGGARSSGALPASPRYGVAELEPPARLAEPAAGGKRGRQKTVGSAEDSGDDERLDPESPEQDTPPPPAGAEAAGASTESRRAIVIESVLSPELVSETVAVALSLSGQGATRRRHASLRARARSSALLPELRLRGGRSTDEALRLAPTLEDPDRYTQSGGAELFFDAQLTWRLHRLLFADEELKVEGLRERAAAARAELIRRVVAQLIAWERARLARDDPTLSDRKRVEAALDQLEAEVVLDVLTDGWFGRRVRSSSARR